MIASTVLAANNDARICSLQFKLIGRRPEVQNGKQQASLLEEE